MSLGVSRANRSHLSVRSQELVQSLGLCRPNVVLWAVLNGLNGNPTLLSVMMTIAVLWGETYHSNHAMMRKIHPTPVGCEWTSCSR